ncbi:hypothetical protein MHB50_15600 [Siminovitchia sp. FSL H7-0308]|uniref:hypothetical protein n=1 Tax=Siminovitchia sp. FSL H7-0308 TaxID=2921432 RepID=UPI0030ECA679
MRGYEKTKNSHIYFLSVIYLFFFITSHLITPTNAYYTHQESIVGEIAVIAELEERGEPGAQSEDHEQNSQAEVTKTGEKDTQHKTVEQVEKKENKAGKVETKKQTDNDAAASSKFKSENEYSDHPVPTDINEKEEKQALNEKTP